PTMIVVSAAIGASAVFIGLILSFHLGTAAAATMALVPIAAFLVIMEVQHLRRRFRGNTMRQEVAS
ncbi:MAG: metal ABC transporter permease, partial [Corynebacterium marinum]|nr:metal ABC transporter permease [Corynebacterium marinum]